MNKSRSICLYLLVLTSVSVWAADPICPGFLQTVEVNGPASITGVDVRESLAVTADNHGLTTWDLSDPTKLERIGTFKYGRSSHPVNDNDVFHIDTYLHPSKTWACQTPTFDCFDLRDLSRPQPFRWQTEDWPDFYSQDDAHLHAGVAFSKDLIAARHTTNGRLFRDVWLLDVSQPGAKTWIKPDVFQGRFLSVTDLSFVPGFLVVLDTLGEFIVFDVTDPAEPFEIGSTEISDWESRRAAVVPGDTVAIVYTNPTSTPQEKSVVDLDNPSSPVVHRIPSSFGWETLQRMDLHGDSGVAIIHRFSDGAYRGFLEEVDFSDPSIPVIVASRELEEYADSLAATPDHAVVGFVSRLSIHERGNLLEAVGATPLEGAAHRMEVNGSLGVLANARAGIITYDLGDPEHPIEIARLDLGEAISNLRLEGSTAVVILRDSESVATIDVSNAAAPVVLDTIAVEDLDHLLEIEDGIAFVWSRYSNAAGERPLSLIDFSDPSDISLRSQFTLPDELRPQIPEIRVRDQVLFVPTKSGNLHTIDMSGPDQPEALGVLSSHGALSCLNFQGDHGFLTRGNGIEVIDITDPANLQPVRTYDDLRTSHIEKLREDLLTLAGRAGSLADFGDLDNPSIYHAPATSRGWYDGALVDSIWLRPSQHVIDVVSLECRPPEAGIRASGRGPTIWFEDLSRYQVTERTWDFGDGETSRFLNPVHTYSDPGHYTVTLTVSSPNGADTATKIVEVGPGPVRHQPPGSRRQP